MDYNWEYPGYAFGSGYKAEAEVDADYAGLRALLQDTADAFRESSRVITMAYYPDGRQEQLFAAGGYAQWAELMHMMAYDQVRFTLTATRLPSCTKTTRGAPIGS